MNRPDRVAVNSRVEASQLVSESAASLRSTAFTALGGLPDIGRGSVKTLVLLRHGESTWNKENRFTGWVDVGLTDRGVQEALRAGRALKERGLSFDVAYTSVLKRAVKTLWIVLEEMDLMWLPVHRSWRLNERHYGALQGSTREKQRSALASSRSESGGGATTFRLPRCRKMMNNTRPRTRGMCRSNPRKFR